MNADQVKKLWDINSKVNALRNLVEVELQVILKDMQDAGLDTSSFGGHYNRATENITLAFIAELTAEESRVIGN